MKNIIYLFILTFLFACNQTNNKIDSFSVEVKSANQGFSASTVEIYQITSNNVEKLLGSKMTDKMGVAKFNISIKEDQFYYVKAIVQENKKLQYISVVDNSEKIVLNELSTIANAAVFSNFIQNGMISGELERLKLGKHAVNNLVDLQSGNYGETLLSGDNLTESTTIGKFNTLASIFNKALKDSATYENWKKAALLESEIKNVENTIDLLSHMFQHSWFQSAEQFNLFTKLYPRGDELRAAPFLPYLEMAPNEFALAVRFSGGGIFSPGKLEKDEHGNIWTGNNWMPGSQSNTLRGIGGGMSKLSPSGKALSPDITGFVGIGVNGCGWGTAVAKGQVWMSSFNGQACVYDYQGNVRETKVEGKVGNLMGVGISPVNDDVWICDGTANQMIYFKGGDPLKGITIKVPNLASPFSVVIDNNNDVWVGNSAGYWVTKFSTDNPTVSEKYTVPGVSIRGLSKDLNDDIWVSCNSDMGNAMPTIDPSLTIMEQFTLLGRYAYETWPPFTEKRVGALVLLDKSTSTEPKMIINGEEAKLCGPWGNIVDGENNLWAGNFLATGVVHYATHDMPTLGLKKGDLIHRYQMGLFQEVTDVLVDKMGHVWVANNWNDEAAVLGVNNHQATSTKGGGAGVSVIYGVASPSFN
ncbi:MAG: hypothetical protein P8I80_00850 [Bacteroidales bacterium]|jgi:hypothetical protein|nr:hypothetical protein [Bacteroidales bacterium]MDG2080780.1 hypothetical protein [Bacteroidales bacterium]